ncbi:MAG: ATP-binding protein [Candidatus Xenobia bacterium]
MKPGHSRWLFGLLGALLILTLSLLPLPWNVLAAAVCLMVLILLWQMLQQVDVEHQGMVENRNRLQILEESVAALQQQNDVLQAQNVEIVTVHQQDRLKTRHRDLLLDMYQSVAQTVDLHELLETVMARIKEVVGFNAAAIFLYTSDKTELYAAHLAGLHPEAIATQLSPESGIPAIVAQTGTALVCPDTLSDPRLSKVTEKIGVRSALYHPIRINTESFGAVCLWSHDEAKYTEAAVDVLATICLEAARAIKNAEGHQEKEIRFNFLMKLWETARNLTGSIDADVTHDMVLIEVLDGVQFAFGGHHGVLFTYRKDERNLVPLVHGGLSPEFLAELTHFINRGPLGLPFFLGSPFQVKELLRDSRFAPLAQPLRQEKVASMLWAPLTGRHSGVGALALFTDKPRVWSKDEFQWLDIFAKVISIALENISLFTDLAAEKHQLQVLIDNMPEGVFTTDTTGRVLTWNTAGEQITGWSHRDVVGRFCSAFIKCQTVDGTWCESRCPLKLAMDGGKAVESGLASVHIETRDGGEVPVFITSAPIQDEEGRVTGSILVFRDITKEKEIEQMKEDFLATITHDLKSPLASIMGYTELLLSPRMPATTTEQAEFLEAIRRSSNTLQLLIDNILESTRMEAGKMVFNPAPFPLSGLAEELREMFVPLVGHKHLTMTFQVEGSIQVLADREKIKEVFINLLSNAVKFTRDKGSITVTAERTGAEQVTVRIADTGKGIPPGERHKLFQKFSQVKGERGGTGLGLYIVKKILEAHGQTVQVDSTPGVGTTFTLTLPVFVLPARPGSAVADATVMVVEKDAAASEAMAQTLQEQGWQPICVSSAEEAYNRALSAEPRLIAMDAGLPDLKEFKLLEQLRGHEKTRDIPILMLCDWQEEIPEQCDGHLYSPIDSTELQQKIVTLIAKRVKQP